ncbi:Elongin-B [Halotydeus destructor]|nr:Elongin-B [Halotydeus destructor]
MTDSFVGKYRAVGFLKLQVTQRHIFTTFCGQSWTMIVYLLVRRKSQNIFLEADENDTVREIKLMVEGILKKSTSNQKFYYLSTDENITEDTSQVMQDDASLNSFGVTTSTARAHSPARIGLVFRNESGSGWEQLDIVPYSNPPPLPDIMKPSGDEAMKS